MFDLDFQSRIPIFEQLYTKIKVMIESQLLLPDEQLPAVRVLAAQLLVNPNTVQKAYRSLEEQGYIYSLPGKGSFVSKRSHIGSESQLQLLEITLVKTIEKMLILGKNMEDINDIVLTILRKNGSNHYD